MCWAQRDWLVHGGGLVVVAIVITVVQVDVMTEEMVALTAVS